MKSAYLWLAVAITGCATEDEPEDAGPVPGVDVVQAVGGELHRGHEAQPCGSETTQVSGDDSLHYTTRWRYDGAGRLIREDITGDLEVHSTTQYDAVGHPIRMTIGYAGSPRIVTVLAYDAFGRRIRVTTDRDDDGVDDQVTTYTYADGALQPATRSRRYRAGVSGVAYDVTFHYDALGRLDSYTTDDGPDGTIDRTLTIVYDDRARTRVETERDAAGTVTLIDATELNRSNAVVHELVSDFSTPGDPLFFDTRTKYDGGRIDKITVTDTEGSTSAPPYFTSVEKYRYSGCR